MPDSLLIAGAEILDVDFQARKADVRVKGRMIAETGQLSALPGESVIRADGALLLPGLHDHHVHLAATAAARSSISCGPPDVTDSRKLRQALNEAAGDGWLRGVGYHDSVAGDIDRDWLDRHGPDRPIRIQHRTGQLWVLNSAALAQLAETGAELPADGRLFHGDQQIRMPGQTLPPVDSVSAELAAHGITGVNDMTVTNDTDSLAWFRSMQDNNQLLQKLRLSGSAALGSGQFQTEDARLRIGETKIYLHDHQLPDFDRCVAEIAGSHEQRRAVAFHCVTEVELVFALAALREANPFPGDRIEHGSMIPVTLFEQLLELGVTVVTQPNFVAERGDSYLSDLPSTVHGNLYRCKSLQRAGIPLAFGTDTPYGDCDPWAAMRAAVYRQTRRGECLGEDERLSPEAALAGFLGELHAPATLRTVRPAVHADLCLLDASWDQLRSDLSADHVSRCWCDGELIYSRD